MQENKIDDNNLALFGWYLNNNIGGCLNFFALHELLRENGFNIFVAENDASYVNLTNSNWDVVRKYYNVASVDKLLECANYFVVGSDQLWNCLYTFNLDYEYLRCIDKADAQKISIATSFGHEKSFYDVSQLEMVKKELSKFDYISVREESGISILNEMGINNIHMVIDPVLLCSEKIYDRFDYSQNVFDDAFIFSYILDASSNKTKFIVSLKKKLGLEKAINMTTLDGDVESKIQSWHQIKDIDFLNGNICDFIYCMKRAKFIVTDSFHGVCFAIIFHKPFVCFVNEQRGQSRFEFFYELGLRDRFIFDEIPNKNFELENIDWASVDLKLNAMRNHSYQYLDMAFNKTFKRNYDETNTIDAFYKKDCFGCGSCKNVCPQEAICMQENSEGFLYPVIDYKKCIHCGKCKRVCPIKAKNYNENGQKFYAAFASDDVRKVSSSGGIFPLLAQKFLTNKGFVAGAAFCNDYKKVEHRLISKIEELPPLLTSKYLQSDCSNVYMQIKNRLDQNDNVLFCGCPCQVAGLKNFIGSDHKNLFTIDLICHGVPSPKVWASFINEIAHDNKIVSCNFRDKSYGWSQNSLLSLTLDNDFTYQQSNNGNYYFAFLENIILRESCYRCKYASLHRQGDLTVGDFWDIKKYDQSLDDKKGTSLVIVNNEKGEKLFADIKKDLLSAKQVSKMVALQSNLMLKFCARYPYAKRKMFFELIDKVGFKKSISLVERLSGQADKNLLIELNDLKNWVEELEKAKDWFLQQIDYKNARIEELENWTKELQNAKDWLASQVNFKDCKIDELEKRIKDLMEGA